MVTGGAGAGEEVVAGTSEETGASGVSTGASGVTGVSTAGGGELVAGGAGGAVLGTTVMTVLAGGGPLLFINTSFEAGFPYASARQ